MDDDKNIYKYFGKFDIEFIAYSNPHQMEMFKTSFDDWWNNNCKQIIQELATPLNIIILSKEQIDNLEKNKDNINQPTID